jgi:hypothetical protein
MTETEKPSGAAHALSGADEVRIAWDEFRAGEVVDCPNDGAPLALAVDASAGAYRFVCTRCGVSSSWFESGPRGIQLRSSTTLRTPGDE